MPKPLKGRLEDLADNQEFIEDALYRLVRFFTEETGLDQDIQPGNYNLKSLLIDLKARKDKNEQN